MKKLIFFVFIPLLLGCSAVRNVHQDDSAIPPINSTLSRRNPLTEEELKYWFQADPVEDSMSGISLRKAQMVVKNKKAQTVIVGMIDSGIDIDHLELKKNLWLNGDEIPDNTIDDDRNGYADDVHGWNFLGGEKGNLQYAQLEITRFIKERMQQFEGRSTDQIPENERSDFELYQKLKTVFDKESERASQRYFNLISSSGNVSDSEAQYIKYLEVQNKFHYNLGLDPREIIGDNSEDITDVRYGNNDVIGSKNEELHGTHVAGIVARLQNAFGRDSENLKIMAIRAVPNGDEYDKDVALAIRYAVDNGAKVVNMSFGKRYSFHSDWVFAAMKYAESKDVLLVQSSGNESKDIDQVAIFPNDSMSVDEYVDNVITVGATTQYLNETLIASFSNYGKKKVDIFAPGVRIYSAAPNNAYRFDDGTSMASPLVAAVAALIRSYYPNLTASQVKHIIMESGASFEGSVILPGTFKARKFSDLSVSGKILNAYNAFVLAERSSF